MKEVQTELFGKAKRFLDESIITSKTYEEIKNAISTGKIAFAPWCENVSCEAKVKQDTGAKTLNIPFDQPKEKVNCSICNSEAKVWVYFARSY